MRLSADTFAQILKGLRSDQPARDDLRKTPRVGLRAAAEVRTLGPGDTPFDSIVRDVCRDGIGLLITRKLDVDQGFLLLLPNPSGAPLELRYTVKYCHKISEQFWILGAELVRI